MAQLRIDISGWRYAPWRGKFYPENPRQKDELVYAGRRFSAVEINGTFHSLQWPESFGARHDTVPEDSGSRPNWRPSMSSLRPALTKSRRTPIAGKGGQRKAESLYCTGNGRENRFEVLTLPPGQGESADWTDL